MRQIICEDCRRRYDYDRDEFCPRCGAFNQPVKTWGEDAQGNVIRVDGVNERNHAGSFVHSEVHREKRVRRAVGMDKGGRAPANRSPAGQKPPQQKRDPMWVIKALFIIIGLALLITWGVPLLLLFF